MKRMLKTAFALALVMALALAAIPATALAASSKKPGTPKIVGASADINKYTVRLKYKWTKVAGAAGYDLRYNVNWSDGCGERTYTWKYTRYNSAKVAVGEHGIVDFQVRAYKYVNGKKVAGEWASFNLSEKAVDALVAQRMAECEAAIGTPTVRKASRTHVKDALGLKLKWRKVAGAEGYEYRFNPFADTQNDADDYETGETKSLNVKIGLQAYGGLVFQVRAYKRFGGKRLYGPWATYSLSEAEMDKLLTR